MRSYLTTRIWPLAALLLGLATTPAAIAKPTQPRLVKWIEAPATPTRVRASFPATAPVRAAAPSLAPAAAPLELVGGQPLLKASVAYVVDQDTGEVLLRKNDNDVRPIASLTKLMSGMVLAEARLPLGQEIVITEDDVDRLKGSSSRLQVGTRLTRGEALHIALMSSENRATHALARTYPGGVSAFVEAMNIKARQLGMSHTRYVEPTGLSSRNQSSARDLALLTVAAYHQPLLRQYSTSPDYRLGHLQYVNSNRLVRGGDWQIGVQKTGYISEAGRCMLLQTRMSGRKLVMVFLDSADKVTRIRDAEMVKRWLATRQG